MKLLRQDILSQQYGFNTCRHSLQGGMLSAQHCNQIIHLMYARTTTIQEKVSSIVPLCLTLLQCVRQLLLILFKECLGLLALIYTEL